MIEKFFKPETITEAVELKDKFKNEALFFAGGTEINSADHPTEQKKVISTELLGLETINKSGKDIIIGSSVTMQELIDSELIPESLKTASKYMTNRNIRNMATIGGNIGVNRSCSILLPVLIALKAKLKVTSSSGEDLVNIYSYIEENRDDLILEVILPDSSDRLTDLNRFTRSSNDLAILNIGVSLIYKSEKIEDIIIAIGGVDKHVIRLTNVEEALNGRILPKKEELEELIKKQINPIDDIRGSVAFKTYLTGVMVTDCIYSAFDKEEK